jgi:hypothetical protein
MIDRSTALQRHVHDMLALAKHIYEAIQRQHKAPELEMYPEAVKWVSTIENMLAKHVGTLESYLNGLGGDTASAMKKALARLSGTIAGLYGRMREHEVSRMLRDDYTAVSMLAISYEMLHTVGLAHREMQIAQIALAHLKDLTPIIVELSRVVPHVVAAEVAHEEGGNAGVAIEAEINTHRAWSHEALSS